MNYSIYILAGWFIDGNGGPIREKTLLKIVDSHISDINHNEKIDHKNIEIIDLSHCTLLPPLVDSHVHLFMSGTDDIKARQHQLVAGFDDIKDVISGHIEDHLSYGILAVRDGGDAQGHTLRFKKECFHFQKTPLFLKTAGKAWNKKGRYGKLIGRSPSDNQSLADAISKNNNDIDHVKIVNSGLNSLTMFGKETKPQFELGELKEAVAEAEKNGLKVMVHTNGKRPVNISINAGCHSIEHGFFMGRENLELLAEKKIFWVPTACTMNAFARHLKKNFSKTDEKVSEKNLHHQLEQIAMAKACGVRIALGTDSGSIGVLHGKSVIDEIKLLMAAGFSTAEAVRCATSNGSKLLGIDKIGKLAKGKPATFIAVKGNPSEFPENLKKINSIYINGRPFYSSPEN